MTNKVNLSVRVRKLDVAKHLVYGEVYAPNVIDSHGDMMLPEDVELLAHRFMLDSLNNQIDVMHDNAVIDASAVESFVAKGNPEYTEGAWVVVTKINDSAVWDSVLAGGLNGYSMEVLVRKRPAVVEVEVPSMIYGITAYNQDHAHAFVATMEANGSVSKGVTSVDNGHSHAVLYGTATEVTDGHSHRFFI